MSDPKIAPLPVQQAAVVRPQVSIYGAGIAGLTAAHELAVRGWQVTVYELAEDPRQPGECDIGGMARSQWSQVPWPTIEYAPQPGQKVTSTLPPWSITTRIAFGDDDKLIPPAEKLLLEVAEQLQDHAREFDIEVRDGKGASTTIRSCLEVQLEHWPRPLEAADLANLRLQAVRDFLKRSAAWSDIGDPKPCLTTTPIIESPSDGGGYVTFLVRRRWLPGEHGFRFFPSFYKHLFDTMKRIRIAAPTPAAPQDRAERLSFLNEAVSIAVPAPGAMDRAALQYRTTHRSVFDNLVPTTSQALTCGRGQKHAPSIISRRRARSLEEVREWLKVALVDLGFTGRDLAKLQLRLLKFMTSSSERRERDYETISWLDFLGADGLSAEARDQMDRWPQALVAMTGQKGDARTIGDIFVQMLLDQIVGNEFTDATLNGPTSVAWFDEWRRFLELQGVEFKRGELTALKVSRKKGAVYVSPQVNIGQPDGAEKKPAPYQEDGRYHVIALPLLEAQRLVEAAKLDDVWEEWNDGRPDQPREDTEDSLRRLRNFPTGDGDREVDSGSPLQHMAGIVYYFDQDVQWVDGHTYFPGSEWALTAISQAMFWEQPHTWRDGYRGTLSVCISNWSRESRTLKLPAWKCTRQQIAEEVWRQICDALPDDSPPPTPIRYHLDDNIEFRTGEAAVGIRQERPRKRRGSAPSRPPIAPVKPGREGQTLERNRSPLLVNLPGQWSQRPGRPDDYRVYFGHTVFAGTYMQTYTRLTTMEAANESARHAVNALLRHYERRARTGRAGNPCDIWKLEDRELEDLTEWRQLDKQLVAQGLPHALDVLDVERAADALLPAHGQATGDARGLDLGRALFGVAAAPLLRWWRRGE